MEQAGTHSPPPIAADRPTAPFGRRSVSKHHLVWAAAIAVAVWASITHTDQFVVGLIVGSLYSLSAVGLTLIYGITKTPHIAHGDAMMLMAYVTFFALFGVVQGQSGDVTLPVRIDQLPGALDQIWRFSFGYGFILALLVGVLLSVPIFLLIDRYIYQPFDKRGSNTAIIAVASLGVAISMRGLMLMIWGSEPRNYTTGIRDTVQIPGFPRLVADQLFIVVVAAICGILVSWLLFRTTLGKSMRAMADNPDLARTSGISTDGVRRATWIVGGTLIAIAGSLLALQAQLKPELGFILLLPIFASAILGGIGSPQGAFLGGLTVGVMSEVTVGLGIISPGYKIAVAFALLIAVILIRPQGFFGVKE